MSEEKRKPDEVLRSGFFVLQVFDVLVAVLLQHIRAVSPILFDLDVGGQINLRAEEFFHVLTSKGRYLFNRLTLLCKEVPAPTSRERAPAYRAHPSRRNAYIRVLKLQRQAFSPAYQRKTLHSPVSNSPFPQAP